MDPVARQFEFDFEAGNSRLAAVNERGGSSAIRRDEVGMLFLEGVRCEEQGRLTEAAAIYEQALEIGEHAPAAINLGTILYNQRQYQRAEEMYRRATVASPDYALAFFDLGNVLDELQKLPDAIEAYRTAIGLAPDYADAHYNLALAYERSSERRRALRHWRAYAKLDPVGPWANHARMQARKILDREGMTIAWRNSEPKLTRSGR